MKIFDQFPGTSISSAEYHGTDAVSHSRLEVFRKRPRLYYKRFVAKTIPPAESRAFDVGRAAHDFILEGQEAYMERVAVWTGGNKVKAKTEWALFQIANAGKAIITADEENDVLHMAAAVAASPEAMQLLDRNNGAPEMTWRVNSKALPIPLQCRTDWFCGQGCELSGGKPYVVDLKTTPSLDDAEYRNFQKSFVDFGYHRQAGFYTALLRDLGIELSNFFFIAVEKQEPFGLDIYRAADSAVAQGLNETITDLQNLTRAYETDTWANRPGGVIEISCPDYYLKKQNMLVA
jgi:hypothetical protein